MLSSLKRSLMVTSFITSTLMAKRMPKAIAPIIIRVLAARVMPTSR